MWGFLKKERQGKNITFKIDGLHCTSCSLNIDGALEDTPGVISATTSYAQAKTVITYDPAVVSIQNLKSVVESLEYQVTIVPND